MNQFFIHQFDHLRLNGDGGDLKTINMFGIFKRQKDYMDIDAREFIEMAGNKHTVVLDVRTPGEFKSGHMPGAKNLDFTARDFVVRLEKLDPDREYLLYCHSGARSRAAAARMSKSGFNNVCNLKSGIIGSGGLIAGKLK